MSATNHCTLSKSNAHFTVEQAKMGFSSLFGEYPSDCPKFNSCAFTEPHNFDPNKPYKFRSVKFSNK